MDILIKGLQEVSKVGYPKPLDDDEFESVYFLAKIGEDYDFRLGTYNFQTQEFRSDNGYGGEIYDKKNVIAWNYWYDDNEEYAAGNGETVTFVPID